MIQQVRWRFNESWGTSKCLSERPRRGTGGFRRPSRGKLPGMGDVDDPPRARRTGGRSARVYAAVLKATVAVLYERGFDALSIRGSRIVYLPALGDQG
jgi:hypothetical protein